MFPRVYQTLTANATVVAMVGDRIGRHGVIQQTETRPYITWQIATDDPVADISDTPSTDFTTVQIGLKQLAASNVITFNLVMAGTLLAAVPIFLVLVLFERQLIRGLTAGAVKG